MNLSLKIFIVIIFGMFLYYLFKPRDKNFTKEIEDILSSEKYKVKGQYS